MPTRKVFDALVEWRRFPREIASDLSRFHRIRIAEWHAGPPNGLSSYELLELLEFMDEDGAYKKAKRGGRWSEKQWAVFATANETAVARACQFPGVDSDQYGGRLFIPPEIAAEMAAREQEANSARAAIFAMADISRQPGGR